MHSSRMRTVRTVRSSSRLLGGEGVCPGGVCPGGVCPGVSAWRGVCSGVSAQGEGVYPGGVSAKGDVCPCGGVCIPACTGVDTPPPVDRMTDKCNNTTFPQLRLRPVIISLFYTLTEQSSMHVPYAFFCSSVNAFVLSKS